MKYYGIPLNIMEMLEILVIRSPPPGRASGSTSPAPRESTYPRVKINEHRKKSPQVRQEPKMTRTRAFRGGIDSGFGAHDI